MAITYTMSEKWPTIKFPKLHKVVYDQRSDEQVLAGYQRSYKDHLVDTWLETNCKHPYYHSPGYQREKYIQFECDEEAFMFALQWSN